MNKYLDAETKWAIYPITEEQLEESTLYQLGMFLHNLKKPPYEYELQISKEGNIINFAVIAQDRVLRYCVTIDLLDLIKLPHISVDLTELING